MDKRGDITRSSAAEYLTFIAASGESGIEVIYSDENIWLTQKMMGVLYNVATHTVNYHLKKIFADRELNEESVIRNFRITATDGKKYTTKHYNLKAIIAVGNKVDSSRAVQFRKWANNIIEDYTIKGWAMDDERIKRGGSILTDKYFEEQLERIREIRLSERMFYQKITDIYATAIDYDKNSKITQTFFKTVQNKLHYATHRHTAPELIMERADASKSHMGLTSWKNAPNGKIVKSDVTVAKNYLNKTELNYLARIVTMYLDYAELQAERRIPMTMEDWAGRLDSFLEFNGNKILTGAGKISTEEAKLHAETQYEKYRIVQDQLYQSDFDKFMIEESGIELQKLEEKTKGLR